MHDLIRGLERRVRTFSVRSAVTVQPRDWCPRWHWRQWLDQSARIDSSLRTLQFQCTDAINGQRWRVQWRSQLSAALTLSQATVTSDSLGDPTVRSDRAKEWTLRVCALSVEW